MRKDCPDVEWVCNDALLGSYGYLDIFLARDIETAARLSTLIRTFGRAHTAIWAVTEGDRFKEIVRAR